MNIQPIQYGRREAVIASGTITREALSDTRSFPIELKDLNTNLLYTVNTSMLTTDYMGLGESEEERIIALLASEDIIVLPTPIIL